MKISRRWGNKKRMGGKVDKLVGMLWSVHDESTKSTCLLEIVNPSSVLYQIVSPHNLWTSGDVMRNHHRHWNRSISRLIEEVSLSIPT
jgi:hypothetical protein